MVQSGSVHVMMRAERDAVCLREGRADANAGTEESIRFITDVANPAGGFIVDIWHAQRGGTPNQVIPELLPLKYMVASSWTTALPNLAAQDSRTPSTTGWSAGPETSTSGRSSAQWSGPAGPAHLGSSTCRPPLGSSRWTRSLPEVRRGAFEWSASKAVCVMASGSNKRVRIRSG